MLGDKVTIISTIFLLGALFSIGMTGDAAALPVTVDGTINGGEYAHSVVVDKTPDLGGVYDPGPGPPALLEVLSTVMITGNYFGTGTEQTSSLQPIRLVQEVTVQMLP